MDYNWARIDAAYKEVTTTTMTKKREAEIRSNLTEKDFAMLQDMVRDWEEENCE